MEPTGSATPDPRYLHIPFSKRWDKHRDKIQGLYIDEGISIEDIASKMKDDYMFDASVRQYKYHIKKWGLSKNISSTAKAQVVKALEKRHRKGIATGEVRYKGEPVDKKKLQRYLNTRPEVELKMSRDATIFAGWDFYHQTLMATPGVPNHQSPAGTDGSTPSAIAVLSPPQIPSGSSPSAARSPMNAPTPTTIAIRQRTLNSRAAILLDGRYGDFLKNMSEVEQRISVAWLDQFWYFSFKTFKHWGKGPRVWTPAMLQFGNLSNIASLPNTPSASIGHHDPDPSLDSHTTHEPPSLCRWSIHLDEEAIHYDAIPSPPPEPSDHYDVNNPDSWPEWPRESVPPSPITHLQEALRTNGFSSIEIDRLPLSLPQVAKAAAQSPEELLVESIGFAIMARNSDLLRNLLRKAWSGTSNLGKLYPFHLAATYLNGAKSCCEVMCVLTGDTRDQNKIRKLYVNNLGHTVLDSLMMTILKAHTSCLPEVVDQEFQGLHHFAGEEVDPCGRWDADAPCIRNSNASSRDHIPQSWKHMFCHTSVQAICHSIITIWVQDSAPPDIETPSGLFVKSCGHCGDRLEPLPLHTLVMTTFHLAQSGCEGETLFGALACLVCLLRCGADPCREANISLQALIGADNGDNCTHRAIDPLELATFVPQTILATWTREVQLGWEVFLAVLQLAQQGGADEESFEHLYFCLADCLSLKRRIGPIWASIQTEYLTYRRLNEGDPWISDKFSMLSIIEDLRDDRDVTSMPLINRNMMKPYCFCGEFDISDPDTDCAAKSQEACAFYFSNLEDWNRSTFLSRY